MLLRSLSITTLYPKTLYVRGKVNTLQVIDYNSKCPYCLDKRRRFVLRFSAISKNPYEQIRIFHTGHCHFTCKKL